ncbi:variant erythrocyte surface antigen-1 alpha subunit [Babesia bovis T2Bo]|uniref:Variant erythrocyte surface antigen-1, alpha subunit n=1 Tax=Babesia bovis TaxID=5865 RepID=A7AMB3_BABBO|nr:variant erythrocyte surface antigen-1 alpha subunit [Babesia bovis T2Bo]EDO07697.1 variant erythrocyte surface antigen-1 alpha subunit [Babesia bovis T2Bo]|eukprot:XP_001611265.1 variant erythrocyte surface antigen-1, alpha subunit [Babesia bovis T2Bo]
MKWKDPDQSSNEGHHLGRRCTKCMDSGGNAHTCSCITGGGTQCTAEKCKCALAGKCCKCCCKDKCSSGCAGEKAKCICIEQEDHQGTNNRGHRIYKDTYQSAYGGIVSFDSYVGGTKQAYRQPIWNDLNGTLLGGNTILDLRDKLTPSQRRHQCARILLGSVCLIWSSITYMYWTGKYHKSSPRWNNHILDGSGLDDGTLSQWLQALGFPKDMLNNHGPGNRWDAIIWDGLRDKLYLGFPDTGNGANVHGIDDNANTFRQPAGMNYAGYIHTLDKGAFDKEGPFKDGTDNGTDTNQDKRGALYKLHIVSCSYFTGLQKKTPPKAENRTPKTIREILYWLSALPYSQAYTKIMDHCKEKLDDIFKDSSQQKLSFTFKPDARPFTVQQVDLYAHFQAVTQYCPLVLIGIQGGLGKSTGNTKGTDSPAIHSLYANSQCSFTYPTVSIQAYNQVVHYIRALFYQLYFLRKQCEVKVAMGGKWRECRYGKDLVSKGVISWMCLGCNPMEHDRKCRVKEMGNKLNKLPLGSNGSDAGKLKDVLEKIGEVVVQLGNAQQALEGKDKDAMKGVIKKLGEAKMALEGAKNGLNGKLKEAKTALDNLTGNNGGSNGKLKDVETKLGSAAR